MQLLSSRFKDRPMTPLQSALYWTEYVINHHGADHLRPASVDLSFYQYMFLDVAVILLGCLLALISALYLLFKYLLSFTVKRVFGEYMYIKKTS